MHSITINRISAGTMTVLLTGAVGYGMHQANRADATAERADAWQAEAAGWQGIAQDAASRNAALAEHNAGLVDEYNALADQVGAQRAAAAAALVVPDAPAVQVQPVPAQTPESQAS